MRNYITIGGKIGFLNEKNGKYQWAEIKGINTDRNVFLMEGIIKQGKKTWVNNFEQPINDTIKYLKEISPDFKDRYLLKYKGTSKMY